MTQPYNDPYWPYVTLLLHGDGANGAQNNTFLDSSTNNFTITRNGNTSQGSFSPYNLNWSNYTAGTASAGSKIDVAGTSGLFGSNVSYTIEGWFNFNTITSGDNANIIATGNNTSPNRWIIDVQVTSSSIVPRIVTESNAILYNGSTVVYRLGTWVHIAAVNDDAANTFTFYVNGVPAGSRAKVTLAAYATLNLLCNSSSVTTACPFYVSNFRIVNGVAVYSRNFTPSILPLTAITNTALLTFKSNRFVDNSTNTFAMTPTGTQRITGYSPFNPTAPYSTTAVGGSMYFDGNDWLSVTNNGSFNLEGSAYTIEFWAWISSTAAQNCFVTNYQGASNGWTIQLSSGVLVAALSGDAADITGSAPALRSWNHIALSGQTNSHRLFLNGVQVGSTFTGATAMDGTTLLIGQLASQAFFNGYLSNLRIIKGTNTYTANFTPPTTPLTAVTNTQLLLNGTNGAIFDNAMQNHLETEGNAQINTSVVKFGTGSLAFDGSGDFLQAQNNEIFNIGSGDFTIEAWVYTTTTTGIGAIIGYANGTAQNSNYAFQMLRNGTQWQFQIFNGNTAYGAASGTATINVWTHVAMVRVGSLLITFINGTVNSTASVTTVAANNPSGSVLQIGQLQGLYPWTGYMCDLRFTRGIARYIYNFTPPTAAFQNQ